MTDNTDISRLRREKRFYYGYVVVIAAFFIMFVSWAAYNSFGVFLTPILDDFNWNRAVTSGAFSLSMFLYGVLGIVVGGLNDRFGPRTVLTFCGFFLGLGFILMSQIGSLWQLYLFLGIIVGTTMSGVWVPQMSTIARWFVKRRTLMTGIVIAGVGVGQLVGPIVISRLITKYGWSSAYMILGVAVLILIVVAAQLLRRDPYQMGQVPLGESNQKHHELNLGIMDFSLEDAIKTPQFWILFGIFICYGYGVFAIVVHIVPHAIDLKMSPVSAANILATRGAVGILGSYMLSALADRIGNKQVYIIGMAVSSVALIGLSFFNDVTSIYLFTIVFGFVVGGMGASESPITAWLFGLSSHGLVYGVVHVGFTVGAAAGPYITGYLYDLTGSYQSAFLTSAIIMIIGLLLTLTLRPIKRPGTGIRLHR